MRKILSAILILATVLFSAGLSYAANPKIGSFYLSPPAKVLTGAKRIAVLDFEGEGGRDVTDVIISALVAEGLPPTGTITKQGMFTSTSIPIRCYEPWATTRVYEVVERSRLEQIMGEQKLGQTGVIDDAQAANLGKVLGVDAILSGSVTSRSEDKPSTEKRRISRKEEEGGDYEIVVNCLTRSGRATAKMRIVSTETAQVLGQTESGGYNEDKKCAAEIGMVSSAQSLISGSISDAAWGLVRYISPAFTRFEGELIKIKAKEYKQKAEEAGEVAEAGDLDRAYAVYYSIYQQDSYNPEVLYNLGVLNEAVCNFAEAKQMYENAASLKPDEKDYSAAARRAEARMTELDALRTLGFVPTKHEWNTSEAALQQASAQKVTVRGGGSDRVDVLAEAKAGSALVGKIPGGIRVQVISVEGEWYKVQLPDRKEGWLPSSKVKK